MYKRQAYGPALTDLVILAPEGRIFVTGPDVVRSVTGQDVDMLRLGGPDTHGRRSGVVHLVADDEADAIGQGRALATLLANQGTTAKQVADVDLAALLPESPRRAYERAMHDRVPILGIWHSGGARLAEGVLSLHACLLYTSPSPRDRS